MGLVVRLYDERVDVYDRAHYSHGEHREEVGQVLSWFKKPQARVLDLGCGSGLHAAEFARRGCRVVGVDKSDTALKFARERTRGVPGVRFEHADLERNDLASFGIQDLVTALGNTVSHIGRSRLVGLFGGVRRALAPGGAFVFNTLYWADDFQRNVVEYDPDGRPGIIWERTLKEEAGTILLKGSFLKEDFTQTLEVSCYKVPEILNLLHLAGFNNLRWSHRLDFKARSMQGANTIFFRATLPKGGRTA